MSVVMYGVPTQPSPYDPLSPDDWRRQADELRRITPGLAPAFSITVNPVTREDLEAAVKRIETQMLALLEELKRLTPRPKRRAKRKAGSEG